ncbi:MAG: DUF5053 domain-containing protein [Muribaculaceae bacterium]|nr:DUF5053 domain-containing protein [Muribaculaceae bacterium]
MNQELKCIIDLAVASATPEESDALMRRAFAIAATAEEKREAGVYLREAMGRRKRPDIDARGILGEAAEALNLSYIAKRYFNKDRTWLYQRLNRSMVNGKPAAFTENELRILSDSLRELSHIIQQISLNLTH